MTDRRQQVRINWISPTGYKGRGSWFDMPKGGIDVDELSKQEPGMIYQLEYRSVVMQKEPDNA